ncbi:hypothetical protein LCGC14_2694710 [marine sediment metagenome]|uniref:Uncharacterized protein n=1 Tax=marine sediment metagenome TaxID=412755 RepID=A0A0F9C980_9ZZZZ
MRDTSKATPRRYNTWAGNPIMSDTKLDMTMNEECGSCGGDIGPSTVFVWHHEWEDCRAIHLPVERGGLDER